MNDDEDATPHRNPHRVRKKGRGGDPQTANQNVARRKPKRAKEATAPAAIRTAIRTAPPDNRLPLIHREPTSVGGLDRVEVTPEGIALAGKLAAESYPMRSIAAALGLGLGTLQRAMERQPELQDAVSFGRAQEEHALVSNLRALADAGNVIANLFLLKARHGYREGVEVEVCPNITIVLPDAATPDAYLKALTSGAPMLPASTPVNDEGEDGQ
jgi:hypothetical protein